jgi:hypothetical protein
MLLVSQPQLVLIKPSSIEDNIKTRKFSDKRVFAPLTKSFLNCLDSSYREYVIDDQNTERTGESLLYYRLNYFFTYLVTSGSKSVISLIGAIQNQGYERVDYLTWQFAIDGYRDYVIESKGKGKNSYNYISGLSSFLKYAASDGLWPHKLKIRSFKLAPTLAKSILTNNKAVPLSEMEVSINKSIDKMDLDGENDQIKSFVSSVIRATNQEIKSKDQLIQVTCEYLSDTLKDIRLNAEAELRVIMARHYRAIRNAERNVDQADAIHALMIRRACLLCESNLTPNGGRTRETTEELKRIRKEILFYGQKGLAAYIYHYHDGITPRDITVEDGIHGYHNSKLAAYLGRLSKDMGTTLMGINNLFNLTSRAQILAQCILYIDTSGNETSVRFLDSECLTSEVIKVKNGDSGKETTDKTIYTYADVKNRANQSAYSPLIFTSNPNENRKDMLVFTGDDRIKTSVPDVILFLQSSTRNYRKYAVGTNKNRLFLTLYKNNNGDHDGYYPAPLSGGRSTVLFGEVVAELTDGAIKIPPNLIRQSTMQLTGLLTKDPLKVKAQGRHDKISSATAYLKHLAITFSNELDIREFQSALEAMVTVDIAKFVEFAGIDQDEYLISLENSKRILQSHFGGVYCSDPTGGEHTDKGKVCDQVHLCPTCPKRRPVLLASVHSILNTLLWNEALVRAFKEIPDKEKMKKWQLWMAFNKYALSVFEQATYITEYEAAKELAETRDNPYLKVFFKS